MATKRKSRRQVASESLEEAPFTQQVETAETSRMRIASRPRRQTRSRTANSASRSYSLCRQAQEPQPESETTHSTEQTRNASQRSLISASSSAIIAGPSATIVVSQTSALSSTPQCNQSEVSNVVEPQVLNQMSPYEDFSLTRLIQEAEQRVFRRKIFWIGNEPKSYSTVYAFFNSTVSFHEKPIEKVSFKCKLCSTKIHVVLGRSGNLLKHVETHTEALPWVLMYRNHLSHNKQLKLDKNTFHLIRFFVNSNVAIEALRDPDLREVLKVDIPDSRTFKRRILPRIKQILHDQLVDRLRAASVVSLIADIWSDKRARDFIAVCAVLHHSVFVREIIVIDVTRMEGNHSAENIKTAIENIINPFEFDKSKIQSIVTDEGSNFLRLFKQYVNENERVNLYLEPELPESSDDEDDENDENNERQNETRITFLDTDRFTIEEYSACRSIEFQQPLTISTERQTYMQNIDFNEAIEYRDQMEPIQRLEFEIGQMNIPRFSCAAHKMNIAVRMSIRRHNEILNMLTTLSKFAGKSHRSCQLARVFEEARCRLKTMNYTRWSSAYLMMLSFLKAHTRACFSDELPFPVSHAELEIYIQILLPIHKFSLTVQRSDCSIGHLLPLLWLLIHGSLERFVLNNEPKVFRDLLLEAIKKKFDYELKSNIYLAAAVLNVEYLERWATRIEIS